MIDTVVLIDTQVANIASMQACLSRAGVRSILASDPALIESAPMVVLPGVGAFAAGMQRLTDCGLVETIRARIADNRPLLAVCLGMQLLCLGSEEAPGVSGTGAIPVDVRRFPDSVLRPQLGWNAVEPENDSMFKSGMAYFANSYRIVDCPPGWEAAFSEYGGRFISALQRGNVLACQFHPELSGAWGHNLIKRWISRTSMETTRPEGATC